MTKLSERLQGIHREFEVDVRMLDVAKAANEAADLLEECERAISRYLGSIDSFNGQGISMEMIEEHNAARDAIDTTLAKLR